MESDREYRAGRVPLPGWHETAGQPQPAPAAARADGVRHLRRMSAWSAAALIVGTGAATAALAHSYAPATQAAGTSVSTGGTATTASQPGGASHAAGPAVTHSVATTSGSGVTVTTTKTVGGKTIVTRVRHAGTYHDN
jgi:hypothetical protein